MTRVLLDENLPRLLKRDLSGLAVHTVAEMGWAGVKNGELLLRAAAEFDVFLAADRNLPHQQALIRSWLELRQAGFSSYLTKPCEPDRVRAQVEKHVARSG